MGSENTKSLKIYQNGHIGTMSIELEKQFYLPAENLKGKIWLTLFKDSEVCGLDLKLQLQEKWLYTSDKDSFFRENFQNLIEMSVNIQNDIKENLINHYPFLPKGNYEFPFNFIIPDYLQPSFENQGYSYYMFNRYVIYACLQCTMGEKFCISNLNYLLLQSNKKKLEESLIFSNCLNVRSWMFFSQGTCVLNVSYPKNNYKFGDNILFNCNIDNTRSKLKVKLLRVVFFQKILLKDVYSVLSAYENKICEKEYYLNSNNSNNFPFCLPGDNLNLNINLKVFNDTLNKNLYDKLQTPYLHLIKDSDDIFKFQPTFNSTIISCEYLIKFTLYFDSFVTYGNRPRVYVPVNLSHFVDEKVEDFEFSDFFNNNNENNINKFNNESKIFRDSINGPYLVEDINAPMNFTLNNLKQPLLYKK